MTPSGAGRPCHSTLQSGSGLTPERILQTESFRIQQSDRILQGLVRQAGGIAELSGMYLIINLSCRFCRCAYL
jgi:hypothetical protein